MLGGRDTLAHGYLHHQHQITRIHLAILVHVAIAGVGRCVVRVGAGADLGAVEDAVAVAVGIAGIGAGLIPLIGVSDSVAIAVGVGGVAALRIFLGIAQAVVVVVRLIQGEQLAVQINVFIKQVAVGVALGEQFAVGAEEEVAACGVGSEFLDALAQLKGDGGIIY